MHSLELPPIGLLGTGYTGMELLTQFIWPNQSWATISSQSRGLQVANPRFNWIDWRWDLPDTWEKMPYTEVWLVITMPPVMKQPAAERARLAAWCQWMKRHRPNIQRVIYISSTGVYPYQEGCWEETSELEPNRDNARLRVVTEEVLAQYFDCTVIRAGGIYGPGRNQLQRLLDGKSLINPPRPIHRIHVHDLARLVVFLMQHPEQVRIVNAVDQLATQGSEILEWLKTQNWPETQNLPEPNPEKSAQPPPSFVQRRIDNRRLLEHLGFKLRHPTFREGLTEIFQPTRQGESMDQKHSSNQQDVNKFGVKDRDFDNFGNNLADKAFEGVDDHSIKGEIIRFGQSLTGWQKLVFKQIVRLLFGKDSI